MKTYIEPSRKIPITRDVDVIVVGGGVAGVAAALAARRNGCSTLLVEKSVVLGGLATLGLVTIYNLLPPSIVLGSPDVRCFQAKLQYLVKCRAKQQGSEVFASLLSARWDLLHHPLIKLRKASETQGMML